MNKQFTTGEVVGITQIPLKTIQRYIKQFPEGFSGLARQQKKGRRYQGQDLKNLLLIRHLFRSHKKSIMIHAALLGEWTPDSLPWLEIENVMEVAQSARLEMLETGKHVEKARKDRLIFERIYPAMWKRIGELTHDIEDQERRINFLELKMRLKAKSDIQAETTIPKKRSFLDKLVDG